MKYRLITSDGRIMEKSEDLVSIIEMSNKDIGSKVINEDGRVIHMSMKNKISTVKYKPGQRVILKNVKVNKKNSLSPCKYANGVYYIYDGKLGKDGRYAIVDSYKYIGLGPENIYGYINQHDINS